MKKLILCLAVAGFSTAAMAQTTFGVKAGVNAATLRQDNIDYKSLIGANGGFLANIYMSPTLSLQPEVLYSMEGAKRQVASIETKTKLGYINVPIMLQYKTPGGFYGEFGPQIGFNISAKDEVNGGAESDIKNSIKSTNLSVGAGLGYNFSPAVGVGARYMLGVSDISEANLERKSGVFSIGLHYRFGQ